MEKIFINIPIEENYLTESEVNTLKADAKGKSISFVKYIARKLRIEANKIMSAKD